MLNGLTTEQLARVQPWRGGRWECQQSSSSLPFGNGLWSLRWVQVELLPVNVVCFSGNRTDKF